MLKRFIILFSLLAGLAAFAFTGDESACKGGPDKWQLPFNGKDLTGPQRGRRPLISYMGLQNHSKDDVVFVKEVAIQPLKK